LIIIEKARGYSDIEDTDTRDSGNKVCLMDKEARFIKMEMSIQGSTVKE